jgi:hypothetical protein
MLLTLMQAMSEKQRLSFGWVTVITHTNVAVTSDHHLSGTWSLAEIHTNNKASFTIVVNSFPGCQPPAQAQKEWWQEAKETG